MIEISTLLAIFSISAQDVALLREASHFSERRTSRTILHDQNDIIPYYIEVERLGIHTQGDSLDNAYFMLKDAVALMISTKYNINFKSKYFEIIRVSPALFYLRSNKPKFKEFITSKYNV